MPTFKYVVKDEAARTISGTLIADNQNSILEELRKRNVTIISIQEIKKSAFKGLAALGRQRISMDDIVVFSRQLATMVDAGIPLVQSLGVLQEQMENKELRRILTIISHDIETGNSLSAALAKHPEVFSGFYINMVKAGESSGMLNDILERVVTYIEKLTSLQRKIRSALIYPAVVVTMAIAITAFLMIKVVPTFKGIFDMLSGQLPLPTLILITVSDIFRRMFVFVAVGIFLFFAAVSRYIRTDKGRLRYNKLQLRLPILGELFRKVAISKFTNTLATLVESGVPILASLDIVAKTSGNKVIELAIEEVKVNVREGEGIAGPLGKSGIFPPMVVRMIGVGEQTGQLGKMLRKISEFYDDQVNAAVAGLTSMIEPLIIAFLGLVVGSIVVALFLPILKITQLLGSTQ